MSVPASRLAHLHALYNNYASYGQGDPGFAVYDLETRQPVEPADYGLSINTTGITDFLIEKKADPRQIEYGAIALFGEQSTDIPPYVDGFIAKSAALTTASGELRFPVIALRHTSRYPNFHFRHEIYHLLGENKIAFYNDPEKMRRLEARLGFLGLSSGGGDRPHIMHTFDPEEIKANLFSLANFRFRPITRLQKTPPAPNVA